ncbi:CidA/LrgA family protein, partial [Pseudomonas sp. GW460-13]
AVVTRMLMRKRADVPPADAKGEQA